MSMNKTDRDNWRKFLGIKDPQTALDAARIGAGIGKTVGNSGGQVGGGGFSDGNPPDGDDSDGAEKGDGAGDAGEQIKTGDEIDRLEDLYDCETGEKVKIDGLGEKGSEQYQTGFQDCSKPKKPSMEDLAGKTVYVFKQTRNQVGTSSTTLPNVYKLESSYLNSYHDIGRGWLSGLPCPPTSAPPTAKCLGEVTNKPSPYSISTEMQWYNTSSVGLGRVDTLYTECTSLQCKQSYIDNWTEDLWPNVDKNHLNWNKEKGCFEPLCPELNTAVSDKFKGCEKERILCDKDGNKVKVEVDGNTVKVTQAKYNQTAEIKNGKVQSVKKLTESQTEAEFK